MVLGLFMEGPEKDSKFLFEYLTSKDVFETKHEASYDHSTVCLNPDSGTQILEI